VFAHVVQGHQGFRSGLQEARTLIHRQLTMPLTTMTTTTVLIKSMSDERLVVMKLQKKHH
jgi:hypothetical protein